MFIETEDIFLVKLSTNASWARFDKKQKTKNNLLRTFIVGLSNGTNYGKVPRHLRELRFPGIHYILLGWTEMSVKTNNSVSKFLGSELLLTLGFLGCLDDG